MAYVRFRRAFATSFADRPIGITMFVDNGFAYVKEHVGELEAMACGAMFATAILVPITCSPALDLGGYLKP